MESFYEYGIKPPGSVSYAVLSKVQMVSQTKAPYILEIRIDIKMMISLDAAKFPTQKELCFVLPL